MEVGSSSLPGTTSDDNCQLSIVNYQFSEGGLAQLARAPALQAGGQRFESVILHYLKEKGTVKGERLAAAVLRANEVRKQIFHCSLFTFTFKEIFDILTHKTVSKDLKKSN